MSGDSMADFITAIETAGVSSTGIWGQLTSLAPLIGSLTVVAIGIYFLRRVLKKASKAKGGI